ncbi:50S ribosomal protein L3 N(5)-glutamine methyltransferase [Candidatus Pandoraea novymonadis]|uniref:50S ribosomal protein L3 glutamine methyltransferase n=1 Tax=Candidatus Pandoraea novymonadis TaxID=1808959 RepID=A0ABX5FEA7_9BURK|nr:50S ribosomal protein L3 N(5)-glutamine methyltransferase [Candidatus Pandoraea novymonadis]PSB92045.1 50S ribosomal protein L3 glutamine methyltransferase [Candidatus Pandoraea novymonadis]
MSLTHPFVTLRDLLRYAISSFNEAKLSFGHGNNNVYDEAVYLLLHTLCLPLDMLDPFLDARLLPSEIEHILSVINRRVVDRFPSAYITNEAWMNGQRFYVDERVIVPRSFFGELIEGKIRPWILYPEALENILDLCTGSGCLPILAAQAFPTAKIDAVDISADALEVARINIRDYYLNERITLYHGDLYSPLPSEKRYELIVTNPPYVNEVAMRTLPAEYLHEPYIALAGGSDGMDIVRRILIGAHERLSKNGILIVEIGHERKNFEAAFPHLSVTWLPTNSGIDDMIFLVHAADLQRYMSACSE